MKICLLLHFYQPVNQQDDILLRIVNECYLPLTRGLLEIPRAKIVVNINAALTEQLINKGYTEVIDNLRKLSDQGKIEFTGSSKYHAFLPLLPEDEIERQIALNNDTNNRYLGSSYQPVGFFSPEMAVNPKVLSSVKKAGYTWLACPELSYSDGQAPTDTLFSDSLTGVNLLFRNKRVSSMILSAVCRDSDSLLFETQDLIGKEKFWFCVMDAETFGHHRVGHEKALFSMLNDERIEPVLARDLLSNAELKKGIVSLRSSTWSNQEQDFWLDKENNLSTDAKSFILWKDPSNPIHAFQWELVDLALNTVTLFKDKSAANYLKARQLLDSAISSDQFWWASAKPWWSLEMIEQGGYELKNVISILMGDSDNNSTVQKAETLYRSILNTAFEWQRTGVIRKKHIETSSTFMNKSLIDRTPPEWFNQLMLEFEHQMNSAAQKHDYEKAIKWRDALFKIHLKTDIYDITHVVDELWSAANLPVLKPFLTFNWDEFSPFIRGYLIDKKGDPLTKESFELWKVEH